MHVHTHMCVCIYIYIYIDKMIIQMYAIDLILDIKIPIESGLSESDSPFFHPIPAVQSFNSPCMRTYIYIYIYIHTYIHTYIFYIHIYVHKYKYIHLCIFPKIWFHLLHPPQKKAEHAQLTLTDGIKTPATTLW